MRPLTTTLLALLLLAPAALARDAPDTATLPDALGAPLEATAATADLLDEIAPVLAGERHIVGFHEMIDTSSGTYAGQRIVDEWAPLAFVTVEVSDPVAFEAQVAADPNVAYTEIDALHEAFYTPNDPFWMKNDYTWGQYQIWADVAWDKTRGSSSIKICVIDTGLYKGHEEFSGQSRILQGYDFVYEDTNPNDPNGHGTHVTGIVGATINNAKGIPGMAQTSIIPIRVLNGDGKGTTTDIAQGIDYCRKQGGHIASMSLGGGSSSTISNAVVNYQNAGGLVIAAVGNDGCACTRYPAGYSGVIGVGSVGKTLAKSSFSNTGSSVDIVAPGERIVSTYKSSSTSYVYLDGTSMATPFVSGVAGLVKTLNPGMSASSVTNRLLSTAQDLGSSGRDNSYGYGLVRADRAVY